MTPPDFIPLPDYHEVPVELMKHRAAEFCAEMRKRRTVRDFSTRPVAREVLLDCLRTAGSAPNGANLQPWHFVVVSDAVLKQKIRIAAEKEEHRFYHQLAPPDWLDALAPLGTHESKPFLETAPCLIVADRRNKRDFRPGLRRKPAQLPTTEIVLPLGQGA